MAKLGYSRDGKKGKLQIVYGLLCAADGCPAAVEVFDGDTADPQTLSAQIAKVKDRFGLKRVALDAERARDAPEGDLDVFPEPDRSGLAGTGLQTRVTNLSQAFAYWLRRKMHL